MKKYLVILFSLFCFLPVVMNAEVKSMNLVEALKDEGIESNIIKLQYTFLELRGRVRVLTF